MARDARAGRSARQDERGAADEQHETGVGDVPGEVVEGADEPAARLLPGQRAGSSDAAPMEKVNAPATGWLSADTACQATVYVPSGRSGRRAVPYRTLPPRSFLGPPWSTRSPGGAEDAEGVVAGQRDALREGQGDLVGRAVHHRAGRRAAARQDGVRGGRARGAEQQARAERGQHGERARDGRGPVRRAGTVVDATAVTSVVGVARVVVRRTP